MACGICRISAAFRCGQIAERQHHKCELTTTFMNVPHNVNHTQCTMGTLMSCYACVSFGLLYVMMGRKIMKQERSERVILSFNEEICSSEKQIFAFLKCIPVS